MAKHPSARPGPYTPNRGQLAGQTFPSFRQYQNALARSKGFASHAARLRVPQPIRSLQGLLALRPRQHESRNLALGALARARRENVPIRQAARAEGISLARVVRWAFPALEKRGRQYYATPTDTLARTMQMLTPRGYQTVVLHGRNAGQRASVLARYHNAVKRYLETGDTTALRDFRGKVVRAHNKVGYRFITDPATLDELARAGELSFETLYQAA
jgi:hypothetical protein